MHVMAQGRACHEQWRIALRSLRCCAVVRKCAHDNRPLLQSLAGDGIAWAVNESGTQGPPHDVGERRTSMHMVRWAALAPEGCGKRCAGAAEVSQPFVANGR